MSSKVFDEKTHLFALGTTLFPPHNDIQLLVNPLGSSLEVSHCAMNIIRSR